eukprot:3570828-Alexandrium_andersonii.AAC.1
MPLQAQFRRTTRAVEHVCTSRASCPNGAQGGTRNDLISNHGEATISGGVGAKVTAGAARTGCSDV